MEQIVGPETLVFNLNQTPSNYPKEYNLNTVNHGESLKFNKSLLVYTNILHYFHNELNNCKPISSV